MEIFGMTGERLGFIGQTPEGLPWKIPAWKQDFLTKPSISVRRGIAWGYNPPYEDTDTLVITAPSGKFVDVRFPKDLSTPEGVTSHPSYWAFSGMSDTTFHDALGHQHAIAMPYTAHCKFVHDIDSRGPGISDEGDMFLLMNGDCLEMGIMHNPRTDKNELYKEYWTSPNSTETIQQAGATELQSVTCVVAETVDASHIRGIAIWMQDHFQGILEVTDFTSRRKEVLSERQTRTRKQSSVSVLGDAWVRDQRSGATFPINWMTEYGRKVRDIVQHEGISWRIIEVHV